MALTTSAIDALEPRKTRYSVPDGNGLVLRVFPSGTKSWVVRISFEGVVRDFTLGSYPEISLAQARALASEKKMDFCVNPYGSHTLNDAFALWKRLKKGNIVSYEDEARRLQRYIIDPLGKHQLSRINAPLVIRTVQHLEKENKRVTLKRVLMRLREIMDLAVCAGYIPHNPCARISKIFKPATSTPMPALSWKELPNIFAELLKHDLDIQNLFLISLATMLRPGEVAKLQWSWIKDGVLTIPAKFMKKRRVHRVPLTPYIVHLFNVRKQINGDRKSKYVFPGKRNKNKPLNSQTLAKWLHNNPVFSGKLVAHGLRSIARSWLADQGYSFEVSEACLAHVVGDRFARTYQRSDFLDARRPIMEAWCAYILTSIEMGRIKLMGTTQKE